MKCGEQRACSNHCKMWKKNSIGKKFGFLTVIEEVERKEVGKKDRLCLCDCGNTRIKRFSKLTHGLTRFCHNKCKLKRGENHPRWNSYISMEERIKGRDYWEYEQWRKKIFMRDNFTCQSCGGIGGTLSAHHKDGYNWCVNRRTDDTNGVTLCETCHTEFHKEYGYGYNTELQFKEWINLKKSVR